MNADESLPSQPPENNAEELSRLLEIELIQKRAAWQRTLARNKNIKTLSVFFLFVVFSAGFVAFYFAFTRVSEERRERPAPTTTATPARP